MKPGGVSLVILKKLAEMGYKPKLEMEESKPSKEEIEALLENVKNDKVKKQILSLLLEGLSEEDPKEILIYGMYVKKNITPIVSASSRERIERTIEYLEKMRRNM